MPYSTYMPLKFDNSQNEKTRRRKKKNICEKAFPKINCDFTDSCFLFIPFHFSSFSIPDVCIGIHLALMHGAWRMPPWNDATCFTRKLPNDKSTYSTFDRRYALQLCAHECFTIEHNRTAMGHRYWRFRMKKRKEQEKKHIPFVWKINPVREI